MLEVSVIDVLSHGPCLVMSCPVFDEDLREQHVEVLRLPESRSRTQT